MNQKGATRIIVNNAARVGWAGLHQLASRPPRRFEMRGRHMEIADWRTRIDQLDEQIVKLLNQRAAAAVEIGKLKQKSNAPIYEPNREQTVFNHVADVNPGPLTATQLQDIYYRVMDVMRALQRVDGGTAAEAERDGVPAQQSLG